jgi:GH25 family lysozyme M1 (1,4-beta-N-acetylmuramidase)
MISALLTVAAAGGLASAVTAHASSVEQGLDVSSYQGSINWSQVAGAGYSFAYIRAVEETNAYPDPDFQQNWNGAMANGVKPGAYLFFNASLDPNAEANALIDRLHSVPFARGSLVPVIDVEKEGTQNVGVPVATAISNLHTIVNDVQAATGVLPGIYTSPLWWDGYIGSSDFTSDPLWVAHYCSPQGSSCPLVPANNWGGFGYQAWQYCGGCGSVPGISGGVDLDQGNPIPPQYDGSDSLIGTHFAAVGSSGGGGGGSGSTSDAAMAVMDSRIYGLTSTGSSFSTVQTWSSTPFYGTRTTTFADVNGSGKASAVAINDSSIFVMPNTGSGTFDPVQNWSSTLFYGGLGTYMADLQGNGYASAVAINPGSIWVEPNTGHGSFGPPQEWSSVPFYGTRGTYLADIDGSGRASVIAVNNDSIWVLRNNGHGSFSPPQEWSAVPFYGTRGVFFADLDGPNKPASAIALNSDSIWVARNLGGGFGAPQEWSAGAFYGEWTYMADVDGSGRASMVAVNPGSIWVEKNNGTTSFGSPGLWWQGAFYGTH